MKERLWLAAWAHSFPMAQDSEFESVGVNDIQWKFTECQSI